MRGAEIESVLAEHFRGQPEVAAVYLYGSVATGRAREDSDVDVGVLYRTPPRPTLLDQPYLDEGELAERLGRPVQIVVLNAAPPDLVHRILRDGVLVVEADPSARIAFEVRARNLYFDLRPVLQQYRGGAGR
ncbi:MAG: nucleotidyltransferase domain-containing protein [Myxococcales bacterium]